MRRRLPVLLLLLVVLCAACGVAGEVFPRETVGEGLTLYYLVGEGDPREILLDGEVRDVPGDSAGEVLSALLAGPESLELRSPFPPGTRVRSCREEGDLAIVDLSEAYGGLSGIGLTLADGCIVLSLCELDHIQRVYLTVEGRPRPFRDQVFTAGDFLLDKGSDQERQQTVRLWFLRGETLDAEERTLSLRMGDQVEIAAIQALLSGPESGELKPICPQGTQLLSLTREGENYVVDLSGGWLEGEEDPRRLQALAGTLLELDPEGRVVFLVEGQPLEAFGGLDLREPLSARDLSTAHPD